MVTLIAQLYRSFSIILDRFPTEFSLSFQHYFNIVIRPNITSILRVYTNIVLFGVTITAKFKETMKGDFNLNLNSNFDISSYFKSLETFNQDFYFNFKFYASNLKERHILKFEHIFYFILETFAILRCYANVVIDLFDITIVNHLKGIINDSCLFNLNSNFTITTRLQKRINLKEIVYIYFSLKISKLNAKVKAKTNMRFGTVKINANAVVYKFIPLFTHDPQTLEYMDSKTLAELSYIIVDNS